MEKPTQKLQESKEQADKILTVRVSPKTRDLLTEILKKVNGKDHGRCIKADAVLALALSLVTQKEIRELQESSLTNADRLELQYQRYIQENSFISKDEWIGRLMKGELRVKME